MFAVIRTGGKQYRVSAGDRLEVEKLPGAAGEEVEFAEVLLVGGDEVTVGTPLVDGAVVRARILDQIRGPKVITFKKRRRKHSSKRIRGHRQHLTVVEIADILAGGTAGKSARKAKRPAAEKAAAEKAAAEKPAAEAGATGGEADAASGEA